MPNIDKKKAADFVKGFNSGGPSFSEAMDNLKNAFSTDEERKKKKEEQQKASSMLMKRKRASDVLSSN